MKVPWPRVPLRELLSQRKEFIVIDDLVTYKRPRVQLHAKGIVLRDEVEGSLIKTKKQQVCRAGEFLVAEIDAKVGGFGIVPNQLDRAIVSSHYFLFCIDEAKLDRGFLDYFIRTRDFHDQVEAQGSTNYAAIRPADVLGYHIQLPHIEEQQRIVARIKAVASQVREAQGLRDAASDEADFLWQGTAARLFEQLYEIHPSSALSDVVSLKGGGTPAKSNPIYWDGEIPWITPKDMKRRELYDAIDHISKAATNETSAKLISPGAVLVVVRGMILAHTLPAAVLKFHAAINQDMKALVPSDALLSEFLCHFLWATNLQLLKLVEKSTHDTRKLETQRLVSTKIPVPPIADQRRIIAELDLLRAQADKLKQAQAETATELNALLPAFLDKAFRGELV